MAKAGPILLISSDYPQFDPDQLQRYTDEGYRVHYIENADVKLFQQAADDIETSEPYGIIAFGAPALHALKFTTSPISRLMATIAYYPPAYICPPPDRGVRVLIHAVPPLPPSLGPGVVVRSYTDDEGTARECRVGFAEMARGSGTYRSTAAQIAMARDLEVLQRATGGGVLEQGALGVEDVWEEFVEGVWGRGGAWADDSDVDVQLGFSLGTWGERIRRGPQPVRLEEGNEDGDGDNWLGKTGPRILESIRDSIPGSGWRMKLLNRTVGVNRVVDEVAVRFRHVGRMEWILPGVEGTGKQVTVGMVLSGGFGAGRVISLRVYWDRSDVRRQVGDGSAPVNVGDEEK